MTNFKKAVKWLREGKKVRRLTFAKDRYLFQGVGGVLEIDGMGNYPIKTHDCEANDWEIYEEATPKEDSRK